jgi:hypothetical protein
MKLGRYARPNNSFPSTPLHHPLAHTMPYFDNEDGDLGVEITLLVPNPLDASGGVDAGLCVCGNVYVRELDDALLCKWCREMMWCTTACKEKKHSEHLRECGAYNRGMENMEEIHDFVGYGIRYSLLPAISLPLPTLPLPPFLFPPSSSPPRAVNRA